MSFLRVVSCRAVRRPAVVARLPSYVGIRLSSSTNDVPPERPEAVSTTSSDSSTPVVDLPTPPAEESSPTVDASSASVEPSPSSSDASPSSIDASAPTDSVPDRPTLSSLRPSPPMPPHPPKKPPRLRTDLDLSHLTSFPSLLHADPILDSALIFTTPRSELAPYPTTVKIYNAVRTFYPVSAASLAEEGMDAEEYREEEEQGSLLGEEGVAAARRRKKRRADEEEQRDASGAENALRDALVSLPRSTPSLDVVRAGRIHRYPLITHRVVQMTGKGRIPSYYALCVVGDGEGLVGYGEGKAGTGMAAMDSAYRDGLRGMDRVERFERRTIWEEVEFKFGAVRVVLRPRPIGFGLRCGPVMHQVCKAAGIKDISAEIYGSRNPMNVIKATCLALWNGEARPGMGDGLGGGGRRTEKGYGARGREEIERARGRRLLVL